MAATNERRFTAGRSVQQAGDVFTGFIWWPSEFKRNDEHPPGNPKESRPISLLRNSHGQSGLASFGPGKTKFTTTSVSNCPNGTGSDAGLVYPGAHWSETKSGFPGNFCENPFKNHGILNTKLVSPPHHSAIILNQARGPADRSRVSSYRQNLLRFTFCCAVPDRLGQLLLITVARDPAGFCPPLICHHANGIRTTARNPLPQHSDQ